MAATVRGERRETEIGDGPFDLAAAEGGRAGSRLPEILVGTLLVALFALAGAWFYSTSTTRVGYVALRAPVERGQVIERSDLTVYQLNTDSPIRAMRAAEVGEIVGKVALVDLDAGTLVTPDYVSESADIPAGWGVVGLDLDAGEIPSFALRPGDRVRVIAVVTGGADRGEPDEPEVLTESAEIVEVGDGNGRGRFVAIPLEAAAADRVAAAAARGEVQLIQVPGS